MFGPQVLLEMIARLLKRLWKKRMREIHDRQGRGDVRSVAISHYLEGTAKFINDIFGWCVLHQAASQSSGTHAAGCCRNEAVTLFWKKELKAMIVVRYLHALSDEELVADEFEGDDTHGPVVRWAEGVDRQPVARGRFVCGHWQAAPNAILQARPDGEVGSHLQH